MYQFINCRHGVLNTLNCTICSSHINTYPDFIWIVWFGHNHNRRNPWRGVILRIFTDVILIQFVDCLFHLGSSCERNSSMFLMYWLNSFINVEFQLKVFQLSKTMENFIIVFKNVLCSLFTMILNCVHDLHNS